MAQIDPSNNSGTKNRTKSVSTKIDMTPMVDLAFLLITFFMLTTSFNKQKAMEVVMPPVTKINHPIPASKAITILLGEDDRIYWYEGNEAGKIKPILQLSNYAPDGIRKIILQKNAAIGNEFVIVIKALNKSKLKNMVDILDEMTITNTRRFAIVTTTPDDMEMIQKL